MACIEPTGPCEHGVVDDVCWHCTPHEDVVAALERAFDAADAWKQRCITAERNKYGPTIARIFDEPLPGFPSSAQYVAVEPVALKLLKADLDEARRQLEGYPRLRAEEKRLDDENDRLLDQIAVLQHRIGYPPKVK